MKSYFLQCVILFVFAFSTAVSQAEVQPKVVSNDSLSAVIKHDSLTLTQKKSSNFSQFIVPASFVGYGVATQFIRPLKRLDKTIAKDLQEAFSAPFPIDDAMQYFPTVLVYGYNLLGAKPKHTIADYTTVMVTSYALMTAIVQPTKYLTQVERPNGRGKTSFPSGHTATAFVGAHLMFREYKAYNFWLAISGYAFATSTGYLRLVNNRHWLSDVVAGAGVGIMSIELAYVLLPTMKKLFHRQSKTTNLLVLPTVLDGKPGLALNYRF